MFGKPNRKPTEDKALPGRDETMPLESSKHFVNAHSIVSPWSESYHQALFGMGCFLGCRAIVLGTGGHMGDRGGLFGWLYPKSFVCGVV